MENNDLDLKNHFLVAMPSITDLNFSQSVIYICAHSDEGTMGVVINRPVQDILLSEVLSQMKITSNIPIVNDQAVYLGGPVQPERGFIIHTPNQLWQSTLVTSDQIGVTSSQDVLQAMATGSGPEETLIVLGYSGWGAGQLENEISHNSWLTVTAEPEILFDVPAESRWSAALHLLGIDAEQLSSDTGHA